MDIIFPVLFCLGVFIVGLSVGVLLTRLTWRDSHKAAINLVRSTHDIAVQIERYPDEIPTSVQESLLALLSAASVLLAKLGATVDRSVQDNVVVMDSMTQIGCSPADKSDSEQELIVAETKNETSTNIPKADQHVEPEQATPHSNAADQLNGAGKDIRKVYEVDQYVSLFDRDIQAYGHFFRVHCKDLSSKGISFICDQELVPDEQLIISLGNPAETIFVLARVANARHAFYFDQACFRIGCEFVKRITDDEHVLHERFAHEIESSIFEKAAIAC